MLILLRHGRTEANAKRLLLGRLDPPLDDVGRDQAKRLAAVVDGAARVVASPLRRTRETAEVLGRPVTIDERWIELDYGAYDGMALADVPAELWAEWRRDPARRAPGGESLDDVGGRVAEACTDLAAEATEHDIVVVTHVSPIKAAMAWALGTDQGVAWRLFVRPGSITRIAIEAHGPVVHTFNDAAHLG